MASTGETDQLVTCLSGQHRDLSLLVFKGRHSTAWLQSTTGGGGGGVWKQAEVRVTGQPSLLW